MLNARACDKKQGEVGHRLGELMGGAPERRCGECEGCWRSFAALAALLQEALVCYSILAFGSARDRAEFALRPALRQQMIERVLLAGGFLNDDRKWVEVLE